MLPNNSLFDFMTIGSPVTKLNSACGGKEKYIWATKNELRWSESFQSFSSYSKIEIPSIVSVWTQDKPISNLLIIETTIKTYKFQYKAPQAREKWHSGIKTLLSNQTPEPKTITKAISRKNTILGESNQESDPKIAQRQSLDDIMKVVKQYSKYCGKVNWDDSNLQNIPQYIEEAIIACNDRKWEIRNECLKEENDPKRLNNKISMLRKRLRMMEIESASSSQTEDISTYIMKEKEKILLLKNRIEEALNDKSQAISEWSGLKADLAKAEDLKSGLKVHCDLTKASFYDVICNILQKGFVCYISTYASQEHHDELTLTPRRGYEEGIYKKRQVKLSSDHKFLSWKAVGLFTKKTFSLSLENVSTIVEGTEDGENYRPFANHKYMSIMSKNMTIIMCIENYYGIYLDGIRELFFKSKGIPCYTQEINTIEIIRLASEQIQCQISGYTRMFNRYKSSLIDSLCTINCSGDKYQSFFYNEIQSLKALNDSLPLGIMSSDSENYLRNEKRILIEKINAMDSFLGSKHSHVN